VTGPAGRSDTAEIFVVADLLVASNRAGARPGIYQISLAQLDDLIPLLVDSATYVGAAYSPDRTQIAFSSVRNKSLGIHIMGADGRRPARQVLRAIGSKTALAWIPDGRRLVFTIGDKRATAIGRLDLRTNSWDTVTVVAGEPSPDVSGAGKIVYAAGEKNSSYVYTIGLEGRTPVRLPNTAGRELSPRWLPTGDLLFITEGDRKGGRFRIVRYEPRTGAQTPLVASEAPILSLAVSRDGATMAYIKKGPNGRSPSALFVQGTAPGSTAREVPLRPGEAITALSF
jgi:Tol biopolymer transport system component